MVQIVYVATNRAFPPEWIKIGKTTTSVAQRMKELSASTSVPTDFECYYAAEVSDCAFVERQLHFVFAKHRINPRKEFFQVEAEVAKAAMRIAAISDLTPVNEPTSVLQNEDGTEFVAHRWDTFNIPIGAEITYVRDNSKKAKVIGVKRLEFDGEIYKGLQPLSMKLLPEHGDGTATCIGAKEWMYEGRLLEHRRFVG